MKKIWSIVLALVMMLSLVPMGAFTFTASAATTSGDFEYDVSGGKATITAYTGSATTLTIPTALDGYPVTSIGACAFYQCISLTSITIPDGVTEIWHGAFADCTSLVSVSIPDSVTHIFDDSFLGCTSLVSISIPDSVTRIGNYAFENCDSLTSVTIPDSVTIIGSNAFSSCDNLTSVTIPNSVTSIKDGAFYNCISLTSITFPDSVTSIGSDVLYNTGYFNQASNWENDVLYINKYLLNAKESLTGSYTIRSDTKTIAEFAFSWCTKLTSVTIPNSVTSIDWGTFHNCSSMTSIIIPSSVTSIGYESFDDCYSLTDVWYTGSESGRNAITIDDGNEDLTSATWHYNFCPKHTCSNACDKTCNNCDETRTVGAHKYDAGKVTKAATCKATGVKTYTCTVCKATKTETIAKKSHSYTAATCTKAKTCKVCGVTNGSKLGHKYTNACDKICNVCKATRTVPAHKYTNACDTTCNVCKASRTITHSYKTITTKATTSKNGSIVKKCSVCGKVASTTTIKYAKTFTLSATSYTYNGAVKTPSVTVKDSAGKVLKKNVDYTVTYSSGRKNTGTYKVTVKMIGKYSGTKTLTFKINPINVSKCKLSLSTTSYTYNGSVKTPSVTVKNANGTKLTKGTHYTVTYASGRKNVGTYKVTVKMKGNYTGTKTLTFKINPANVSKCSVKLSTTSYTYNGSVKTPTVTVKNANGVKLTKGTHYTVTYASGRKNVGTYKVTVKMKGNYTGTKTLTFKINPPTTTVSKATSPKAKTLKITVGKKTTQTTGYQLQYSTSKSFKSVKNVYISNKTTNKTITGLKAKTTYYVRVRTYKTVNGVKYYSGWSTAKSAKTK